MIANLTMNRLNIKDDSVIVPVPGNDLAKLMYYLKCVYNVFKCEELEPYIDFKNYFLLYNIDDVIKFARIFNPRTMIKSKLFILDNDLKYSNKFYKITDETYGIHFNEEILISGRVAKVSTIMFFKNEWIRNFYLNPLQRLTNPPLNTIPGYVYTPNNDYTCDDALCSCIIF